MDDQDYADALLAAALRYAAGGLYVFPAFVDRPDPAQHAKTARFIGQWRKASTRDPAKIAQWWGDSGPWRGAHVCVDCGKSQVVVADADGDDGVEAMERLLAGPWADEHGIVSASTPTGGKHYWFREDYRHPIGNSASLVAPGVDMRGMGGLIYAAPSRDSAGTYSWDTVEPDFAEHRALPVVPMVIIERTKRPAQVDSIGIPPGQGTHSTEIPPQIPPAAELVFDPPPRQFTRSQAIEFCAPHLAALRAAVPGTINTRLNDAAKSLSHFLGAFWGDADARGWLHNALSVTAYDGATWRADDTINSAFRSASASWRAELVADPFGQDQPGPGAPPELSLVDAMLDEMLTPEELLERPPPVPLIMDWLDLDSLAWLIGKPGSYKSFLALDYAGHVGQGLPWRGHPVRQGEVVYLVAEGTTGMGMRVRAWQERHGPMKAVRFLPRPVQAAGQEWAVLVEACRRIGPALVVLDTQARVTVGMDENDNTEMGRFIHRAEELRAATGACVLVVHHIGRNGEDARGASALDGAQSTEIKIGRSDRGPLWAVISQDKQKDMAETADLEVGLEVVRLGQHPETGRDLSSLVLAPVDPFDTAGLRKVRDWIDNLTSNQADLVGIMVDHFTHQGATKAELRRALLERQTLDGRPHMPVSSYYKAWDSLVDRGAFAKVKGTQKFMIDPDADVTESNESP